MIARRVVRPLGALALTTGLALGAVPTLAQDEGAAVAQLDLAGAPVDLHEGSCAAPVLDPWASIGRLERQDYGEIEQTGLEDVAVEEIDEAGAAEDLLAEDDEAPLGDDEEDEERLIEDPDERGVLEGGEVTETGREGDPVEESAEAAVALGDEISEELAEDYGDVEGEIGQEEEEELVGEEDEELVDESAVAMIVDDVPAEDVEGIVGDLPTEDEETDPEAEEDLEARPLAPAFYVAEGGVDADYETLFAQPYVVAVHQSPEAYDTILACGNLAAVDYQEQIESENEAEVVVGLAPVEGSGVRGYAVFEYDAAIFGNDVIGVTVHVFEHLPTQRERALAEEIEAAADS